MVKRERCGDRWGAEVDADVASAHGVTTKKSGVLGLLPKAKMRDVTVTITSTMKQHAAQEGGAHKKYKSEKQNPP
jgi:hypothetical protein